MEGANVGYDHQGTDFFDHFGTQFLSTGFQNAITSLNGIDETFTTGTSFGYSTGDCNYNIDQLAAAEGTTFLTSQEDIARGILYEAENYRTIISSPILGAYHETGQFNSRSYLMMEYISFLADIEGPELYISQSNLAFEEVYPGEDVDITFTIQNIGYMDLHIWDINLEGNEFLAYIETPLTLAPQEFTEILVTFRSFEPGIFTGYLEFVSNDRDNELAVVTFYGECLIAPDIELSAISLEAEIMQGNINAAQLTIYNLGGSDLDYNILSTAEWLQPDPVSGTILAEMDETIEIILDASSLEPGYYEADLVITSNDPDEAELIFPVTLDVSPLVGNDAEYLPLVTALYSVYPNPFNPQTTFSYDLAETCPVNLEIYNLRGQKIATLTNEIQAAGHYRISWNADEQASGVYFYRFRAGTDLSIGKIMLMK